MELDKVEEVAEAPTKGKTNRLLKAGWILLDAKVVQLGNKEGRMQGGAYYILGKKQS